MIIKEPTRNKKEKRGEGNITNMEIFKVEK
jgi:hypothetical protein